MNNRHRKTLEAVFAEPTKSNIAWADVEALLIAVGCKVGEGSGSRVRFEFRGRVVFFHRPHPQKEAIRYQVRDARKYLEELGILP
jgi:HicA toxin of bacterial toxin-antitoxin,